VGLATVHLHWLSLFGELCLSAIDSILKVLYDACWIIGAEDGRSSDNDITAWDDVSVTFRQKTDNECYYQLLHRRQWFWD
jgi:hypothetical protein